MDNSNEKLILKLRELAVDLPKIVDQAGSMLARNVRSNARKRFKTEHKYPFEFQNDFQKKGVVEYYPAEKQVIVDHPAAKRLEYGFGRLTIKPKKGDFLVFDGQDGETVYAKEVNISATKPMYYVRAAIKETHQDLAKKFKEAFSV